MSTPSGGKHDTVENCDNMEEVAVNESGGVEMAYVGDDVTLGSVRYK